MATKLTDQIVDKRLIERNVQKGLIDKKGVEAHLKALKDVASNAEAVPYYDEEEDTGSEEE